MVSARRSLLILKFFAFLSLFTLTLQAAAPTGWFLAGSKPASYDTGVDAQASYNGHASAYLKSKDPRIDGFGTLMQNFSADHYLGKRVRFSAFIKTGDLQSWAGLWMRIDKESQKLAFDNMQDRPIKSNTDWRNYVVVLDVPQEATGIFFGVLLGGTGQVWISNAKFEVVGSDVPTTGSGATPSMPLEPANLNFEN
jgi:hypothetical protein